MGALHEGHLSLVRRSKETCQRTVVSIFVNPTQFGPGEDFQRYPRDIDQDLAALEPFDVDCVFAPETSELYPPEFSSYVLPPAVSRPLEGEIRPGHFQGVATIVLKLLNLVRPNRAFFGQKDFQQSLVVRHMVRDLDVPVDIEICPTVRDVDGLALSSRNRYLTSDQRATALSLYRSLQHARMMVRQGESDGRTIMRAMQQILIDAGVSSVDYAVVCDPETLQLAEQVRRTVVALLACRIGATRLIDNMVLE